MSQGSGDEAQAGPAIHWFRNDLRLADNRAFAAACRAEQVVPVFVLEPGLLARSGGPRLRFMLDCLERLGRSLAERGSALHVREGEPSKVLAELAERSGARLLTFGRDYSPHAKARDAQVRAELESRGVDVWSHCDRVVHESEEVLTKTGGRFSVFTPYARAWWRRYEERPQEPAPRPRRIPPPPRLARGQLPTAKSLGIDGELPRLPTGGEEAAQRRLQRFLATQVADYAEARDLPARNGTSRLSPYLRFGVISARECVAAGLAVAEADPRARQGARKWLDELVWREFYEAILDANPHVLRGAHRREYDAVQWDDDPVLFEAWCQGRTGFPFVDAGMRELLATGAMHNRVRMVVASFLTKDLLIDWRKGERWFMEHLVDGDPASNNGGWQWAASTGTDAQPYFRIFNPTRQATRYDPDGDYVRQWVPEMRHLEGARIHEPWKAGVPPDVYPARVVDHAERREAAIARYRAVRDGG